MLSSRLPIRTPLLRKLNSNLNGKNPLYNNFDNYNGTMLEFNDIFKKCLFDKQNNNEKDEYGYFKLKANDDNSGKKENIINILKGRYKEIELESEEKYSNYEKIILRYKGIFIGIVIIDSQYITFGCELTKEKLEMLIYAYWVLEIEKVNKISKVYKKQLKKNYKKNDITENFENKDGKHITRLQKRLQELFGNKIFVSISKLNDFYSVINECFNKEPFLNINCKLEDKFYILQALDDKTFSYENIIKMFIFKYSKIEIKSIEVKYNFYTILLKNEHIYISVQGYKEDNVIVIHYHANIETINFDNDIIKSLLTDYQNIEEDLKKVRKYNKDKKEDLKIYENFDNYEQEMKAFNKLLNKCIKEKKTYRESVQHEHYKLFDNQFFRLIANDRKTGNIENIINIFNNKYKNIRIVFKDNKYHYSKIIFRYNNVYIGIIVINEDIITLFCNLTREKIDIATFDHSRLNVPSIEENSINTPMRETYRKNNRLPPKGFYNIKHDRINIRSEEVSSPNIVTSTKTAEIFVSNSSLYTNFETENLHKNYLERFNFYKVNEEIPIQFNFIKNINECYDYINSYLQKIIVISFYDNRVYIIKALDDKTFSYKNIIAIFKNYYTNIKIISIEESEIDYTIILKFYNAYIYIKGIKNEKNIILYVNHNKSQLIFKATKIVKVINYKLELLNKETLSLADKIILRDLLQKVSVS